MSLHAHDTPRRPGGVPINYNKGYARKTTCDASALIDCIDAWTDKRRDLLHGIRERPVGVDQSVFEPCVREMIDRYPLQALGRSPTAWIERSVTSAALLLDYRSRRFGRRLKQQSRWEHVEAQKLNCSVDSDRDDFRPLDAMEQQQATAAILFAAEWQRYLLQLLIRPPGDSPSDYEPFPSMYSEPDMEAKEIIARLAHCRPVGAFFAPPTTDTWLAAGGRETCRQPLHCPHCHARAVARLVGRINEGPMRNDRWHGKSLVLVRVGIPTELLNLSINRREKEREALGLDRWLRPSTPDYVADSPAEQRTFSAEEMIRNVDTEQWPETALTPYEVAEAAKRLKRLVEFTREAGVTGGLRIHNIGPQGLVFRHELCVVGEVEDRDLPRFQSEFCIDNDRTPTLEGQPVECVVIPHRYGDAARLLVAGSSWGFDLDQIGARCNVHVREFAFSDALGPTGIRGAMGWQPLFLLRTIAYMSRYRVLRAKRFQSYHAFGIWLKELTPDRDYQSPVQRERASQDIKSTSLKASPEARLQFWIISSGIPQSRIADAAGCSPAAVSQFVTKRIGSPKLISQLRSALSSLQKEVQTSNGASAKFRTAEDAHKWLAGTGRSQRWLADQAEMSPSQISRYLSGKTNWSASIAARIADVAQRAGL